MDIGKALASQGKVRRYFDTDYRPAWDWLNEHYAEVLPEDYVIWEIPHEDLVAAGAEGARVIDATTIIVDPYWDEQKATEEAQDRDDLAVSPHDVHPESPPEYAMYDATHEMVHILSDALGDPRAPDAEYWVAVRMVGYSLEVEDCSEEEILDLGNIATYRVVASHMLGIPVRNDQWTNEDFYGPDVTPEQRRACDELAAKWARRFLSDYKRLVTLPKPYRVPVDWFDKWTLE